MVTHDFSEAQYLEKVRRWTGFRRVNDVRRGVEVNLERALRLDPRGPAAPALLLDLAKRAGLGGIQEWLSFYFKSPVVPAELYAEHDLFIQQTKLKNTLREWMGEQPVTHSEAG